MKLYSPDFEYGASIPSECTCDGDRFLSPSLVIEEVPTLAKSLVLIMEDPDVPVEIRADRLFIHWLVFNMPVESLIFKRGEVEGTLGANSRGEARYTGPCPPTEYMPNEHRYFFKLYALDIRLELSEGATKDEVFRVMEGHTLETAEHLGIYKKINL